MTDTAAPPAPQEQGQQNQNAQNGIPTLEDDFQRQIAEALQPAFAQVQQQVAQAAEQQLAPLRERLQQLAGGQSEAGSLRAALQQGQSQARPPASGDEGASATAQEQAPPTDAARKQEPAAPDEAAQHDQSAQPQDAAPPASAPTHVPGRELTPQPEQGGESALQRWGETLEGTALIILALGETLEGVALLLQVLGQLFGSPATKQGQGDAPTSQDERAGDESSEQEEEGEPSLLEKLSDTLTHLASSLKQAVSHLLDGDSAPHDEQEDDASSQEKEKQGKQHEEEGGPSLAKKVGEAAAEGAASVKEGVGHALSSIGSGAGKTSLQQWGKILDHASTLLEALGAATSSKRGQPGGLSALMRWGKVLTSATTLMNELKRALGDGSAPHQGGGGPLQALGSAIPGGSSVLHALGGGSSSQEGKEDDGSSEKKKGGGVSSALKALTGGSSSGESDGEGGGLLDALTGEGSPLQVLREFSKRQQGPGGLAPKGPMGRKPPPGPLRRDRLPGEKK